MTRSPPRPVGGVALVRLASWLELQAHHPENVMAPIELAYAAGLLEERGIPWSLIDTELGRYDLDSLLRQLEAERPRLIAVQGISSVAPLMLQLAEALRQRLPEAFLLAVGQHASVEPVSLLGPGAYHACAVREYEETVVELATTLPSGDPASVPGLLLAGEPPAASPERPLRRDLDTLPFPAHHALRDRGYRVYHPVRRVRRIRGCPYPCTYCSPTLRNSYGTAYRHRSPENVLAEVELLRSLGFTVLHFKDDVFSLDREHTLALCDALASQRRPLPFTVQTRVDHVDAELFRAMRRAGCTTVSFGIESGSQAIVDRLRKGTTVEQARAAFRQSREAGLLRVGFFLLGSPGETAQSIETTKRFILSLDLDFIQVAPIFMLPGSPLYIEYVERTGDDFWRQHSLDLQPLKELPYLDTELTTADLKAAAMDIYRSFYFRPRQVWRGISRMRRPRELKRAWGAARGLLAGAV